MGVFVGVDGGTGDMEAVVVDGAGAVLGRGASGPSNDPEVVGRMHPRVGEHIVTAVGRALAEAGLDARQVEAVSLNLSGDPSASTRPSGCCWAPTAAPRACSMVTRSPTRWPVSTWMPIWADPSGAPCSARGR